jgi:mannose-6-phosphate isomerase
MASIKPFQVERPWGGFRQFCTNTPATVKILSFKSEQKFSLQSHTKREEFWRVLSGSGVAQIGEDTRNIKAGDELHVPLKIKHRLTAGPEGLEVLEISFGEFNEDEITRYEDEYGRV